MMNTLSNPRATRRHPLNAGALLPLLFLLGALSACRSQEPAPPSRSDEGSATPEAAPEQIEVEAYITSHCPLSRKALLYLLDIEEILGDRVALAVEYTGVIDPVGGMRSVHGPEEIAGNIAQICAHKQSLQLGRSFLSCSASTPKKNAELLEECANQAQLDVNAFHECMRGEDARNRLRQSMKEAASRGVFTSPAIFINGTPYSAERTEESMLQAICGEWEEARQPPTCLEAAQSGASIIILTDHRCSACDPGPLKEELSRNFPDAHFTVLDWTRDEEARALRTLTDSQHLPVVLFDDTVENNPDGLRKIAHNLRQRGPYRVLRAMASFDPEAEICDNGIDDTGNGLVDCQDPTCRDVLACREEKENHMDLFTTGFNRTEMTAIDAMKEVLGSLGGELNFRVRIIPPALPEDLAHMKDHPEVQEAMRNTCIVKLYQRGHKFMDYFLCRAHDIRTRDWKLCSSSSKMDKDAIDACVEGEGMRLLREDGQMANNLHVNRTPFWVANNRYPFEAFTSEQIRLGVCNHNPEMGGCGRPLSDSPPHVHGPDCNH